jgi:hypothetical protein
MLVVMERAATAEQVQEVVRRVEAMGFQSRTLTGRQRTAVAILVWGLIVALYVIIGLSIGRPLV